MIEAKFELSASELKVISLLFAQVSQEDKDGSTYQINIKDFIDVPQATHEGEYERAREITKGLMQKVLQIQTQKGYLRIHFISRAEYERGSGVVNLGFDPKLKPYLLELAKSFPQIRALSR